MASSTNIEPAVSGARILVVEDAPDIQEIIKLALEYEGYQVTCSTNGREALDCLNLSDVRPELILLDLMMPIMDGFEFLSQFMLDPRFSSIPVVVMTAGGDSRERVQKLGVVDFLKKPADLDHLFRVVRVNLEKSRTIDHAGNNAVI